MLCIVPLSWLHVTAGVPPWGGALRLMRPVVASGAAGAGADVGADANGNVGVGASDDDGESYGTGSSGVAPPEGEAPLRGNLLCRSQRSAGMLMLKSKAAV